MTKRLRYYSGNQLKVHVLQNQWGCPWPSERLCLQQPRLHRALVRTVLLSCCDHPVMLGRTIVPAATLRGSGAALLQLGDKPLGQYLFAQPDLQRSAFEFAKFSLDMAQAYWQGCDASVLAAEQWARRSIFYLSGKPLLLSELFLSSPLYD